MENNQNNKNKECEVCGKEATNVCYQCLMYTCDSCFKLVHNRKSKINHKKDKIDYFVPIDTKCPNHPNSPNNLFCIDEKGMFFYLIIIFYLL